MPKNTLGEIAMQEISAALAGLSGARARAEAQDLAARYNISVSRIYDVTRHLRPKRKTRADKGKRRADLLQHEGLKFAAERVVVNKLQPEDACKIARANGFEIPVSEGTFKRYLRQHELNRQRLRHGRNPHRRWEAANPLDLFQFDISGLKERWIDVTTRRILHVTPLTVSKNHPNKNSNLVKLWKFGMVDDHSRLRYIRFVACDKPRAVDVIDFLWAAFRELGIPLILYTDNDPIIVCNRMYRAASILDRAFAESGGFKLVQHDPHNPQATGKVEVGHRIFERFEAWIGLKRETPSIEALNRFIAEACLDYNWRPHSETGIPPIIRFRSGNFAMRVPPDPLLNDAFKADDFDVAVRGDLTFNFKSQRYQLPRAAKVKGLPNPFLSLAGQPGVKIKIIWPPDADYFVAIVDNIEYEIPRQLAAFDAGGEFKSLPETVGQQTAKTLTESATARKRAHKAAGTDIIVPGIDVPFDTGSIAARATAGVELFPRPKIETSPELLSALAPGTVPPSLVEGRLMNVWSAAEWLVREGLFEINEFDQVAAVDMEWLKSLYAGREEVSDAEIRGALGERPETGARVVSMRSA